MPQLAVITDAGNVFGSNIVNRNLEPVFQFSGAKIGFNPQDRFMVAMGNTLAVITKDGSVFGTTVLPNTTNLGPVFQFSGAKIGFNPQDRFMVTMLSSFLAVITQAGDVFGAPIEGQSSGLFFQPQNLGPVFQFSGAKIGFNPQDRFMVTIGGNTLAVITQAGDVFGAVVNGQNIDPVFQFSGAKIGFNPQDRFMVASELLERLT
jgi:ATP-dependent phosphoenolpyruvate carboxykinase